MQFELLTVQHYGVHDMANLPANVERVRDGNTYRYRAYAKDGFCVRLHNNGSAWEARAVLTGAYIGSRKTLALIGALVASYTVQKEA